MKIDIREDALESVVLVYVEAKIRELKAAGTESKVVDALQCIKNYIHGSALENMGTGPVVMESSIEIELDPAPYPTVEVLNNYDYIPCDTEWKD